MSRYESGHEFVVCGADGVALIADDTDVEVIERLWRALEEGEGLASVLAVLVEGCGLAALPDFAVALAESDGAVRIVVRGRFAARVGAGETVASDAPTFWTERHVADAGTVLLVAIDAPVASAPTLPLRSGVVRGASVTTTDVTGEFSASRSTAAVTAMPRASTLPDPAAPVPTSAAQTEPAPDGESRPDPLGDPTLEPVRVPTPVSESDATPPTDIPDGATSPEEVLDAPSPESSSHPQPTWSSTNDEPAVSPHPAPATAEETRVQTDDTFAAANEGAVDGLSVEAGTTTYDDLVFGTTRMASVEDAAVREPENGHDASAAGLSIGEIPRSLPTSAPAAVAGAPLGDHDGLTISAEQLEALRAGVGAPVHIPGATPVPSGFTRVVLVASTGERTILDRGAVVGVRPSAVRETGIVPHLIAVSSPAGEISRRHLEIRVEGPDILAVDLNSTNGTRLLRVGAEPVRLHPGSPTLLVAGDRLDLGDGVVFSFEGLR